MSVSWPEPVERVASFLRAAGAEARLEELREDAASADEAAAAIGCPPGSVVSALVYVCEGRPLVILLPGDRTADPAKVARSVAARRARPADEAGTREATGFEPGAVAPFPLPGIRTVLVERSLLGEPLVWVRAGSLRHLVALHPVELVRLTRGEAADVVQESA